MNAASKTAVVRRSIEDERGAILLIQVLVLTGLLIAVALVIDVGRAHAERRTVQNAADSAALAAAQELMDGSMSPADRITAATAEVRDYVSRNTDVVASDWVGCTDPLALPHRPEAATHTNTCISFDSGSAPTKVRVLVPRRDVPTTFGRVAGVNALSVRADAVAEAAPGGPGGGGGPGACMICSLDDSLPIDLRPPPSGGTPIITAYPNGAAIHANGGIDVDGGRIESSNLSAGGHNYTAGPIEYCCEAGDLHACTGCTPSPTLTSSIGDPLAGLPAPSIGGVTHTISDGGTYDITGGGVIAGDMTGGSLTLRNGFYIVSGHLDYRLGGSFLLDNATLYFACDSASPRACSPGESGGTIEMGHNGQVQLFAPTSGAWAGLAVFYDRNNTATFGFGGSFVGGEWNGLATIQFRGTMYGKSATFEMQGGNGSANINSRIVFRQITNDLDHPQSNQRGTGHIFDYFTEADNITPPPLPPTPPIPPRLIE